MVLDGGNVMVERRLAQRVTVLSDDNDAVTIDLDANTHPPPPPHLRVAQREVQGHRRRLRRVRRLPHLPGSPHRHDPHPLPQRRHVQPALLLHRPSNTTRASTPASSTPTICSRKNSSYRVKPLVAARPPASARLGPVPWCSLEPCDRPLPSTLASRKTGNTSTPTPSKTAISFSRSWPTEATTSSAPSQREAATALTSRPRRFTLIRLRRLYLRDHALNEAEIACICLLAAFGCACVHHAGRRLRHHSGGSRPQPRRRVARGLLALRHSSRCRACNSADDCACGCPGCVVRRDGCSADATRYSLHLRPLHTSPSC